MCSGVGGERGREQRRGCQMAGAAGKGEQAVMEERGCRTWPECMLTPSVQMTNNRRGSHVRNTTKLPRQAQLSTSRSTSAWRPFSP